MKTKGFYWHVHHSHIVEYCFDYQNRVDIIQQTKPQYEKEPRIHLMQPVKGKLPKAVIKAGRAFVKKLKVEMKLTPNSSNWYKVWVKTEKAEKLFHKTLKENKEALEKLHAEECPDCIWNGTEMVFKT